MNYEEIIKRSIITGSSLCVVWGVGNKIVGKNVFAAINGKLIITLLIVVAISTVGEAVAENQGWINSS